MLLLPLALSACTQPEAPEPTPQAVTQESVATSQATTAQPTTSVETKEATTVQPADNAQAQTLFAQDRVMLPSQGNPELVIQDVRAGTHTDVDRVVFEYSGTGLPGVIAAYNPDPRQQASGLPMEVPGNAFLEIDPGHPYGNDEPARRPHCRWTSWRWRRTRGGRRPRRRL